MRLLVACLLVLVAVVLAEPAMFTKKGGPGKDSKPTFGGKPKIDRSLSSHRSSSRISSSSSSASTGDAKAIARQLYVALPTANGSAFFKNGKIDRCTVAEAPAKGSSFSSSRLSSSSRGSSQRSGSSKSSSSKSGSSKSESSKSGSKSGSSKSSSSKSGSSKSSSSKSGSSKSSSSKSGSKSESSKSGSSKSSSSKSGSSSKLSSSSHSSGKCLISSPLKRPLFNFRGVPKGFNGVGLRKKYFMDKHHGLIVRFANEHKSVLTVIVVNRHEGKQLHIQGVRNRNLFVFNKDMKQLFPNSHSRSSQSSHRRSSSSHKVNKFEEMQNKVKSMFKKNPNNKGKF